MPIQLAFQDEIIRKVCESTISAKRRFGGAVGQSLHVRLADLKAAGSPADLVDWGFAKFDGAANDQIVILLDESYCIRVVSNHKPQPIASDKLDWGKVSRVKILSIGRTNES